VTVDCATNISALSIGFHNQHKRSDDTLCYAHLNSAAMRLLLPAPVRPTTPSLVLPGMVNETSLQSHGAHASESRQHYTTESDDTLQVTTDAPVAMAQIHVM
jgi:hypothetical protein